MVLNRANISKFILILGIAGMPSVLFGLTYSYSLNPRTINIGFLDELTLKDGKTASWGAYSLNGFKLGINEVLANSTVTVKIIEKNVSRSPIEAKIAAEELLHKNVDVIVGLREDGQALMVKSVTEGKVPFVTSMATSDDLIGLDSWTLSMALRNSQQIAALVEYISHRIGNQKEIATIVTRNCTYCVDMNRRLEGQFARYGVKVKIVSSILHGSPIPLDIFNDYIFDHEFIGLFTDEIEGLSILKLLKNREFKGTVFGGDSWPVAYISSEFDIRDYASMCLVNSLSFDSSPSRVRDEFFKKYMITYGKPGNDMAGLAFDTGIILGKAIIACANRNLNSMDFKSCIPSTIKGQSLTGATGNFTIDADGGRSTSTNLLKIFSKCKK